MQIHGLEVATQGGEVTISQSGAATLILSIGATRDLLRMVGQALAAAEDERSEWIGEIAPHRYLLVEQAEAESAGRSDRRAA